MIHCTIQSVEAFARYLKGHYKDRHIDSVVAIARGGLIPGVYISHLFDLPLFVIDVKSYTDDNKQGELIWNTELQIDKCGKTVLVIDDICDTGVTFQAIDEYLKANGIEGYFGAVVKKKHSTFDCEFLELVDNNKWVQFQWEIE